MLSSWVFLRKTAGLFWIRMPAFSQWGECSTNSRRIGRSSSHTPAGVSGCLSDGIARHAGRCWRRLSCVLIFGRIYGELSSLCVRITVHFGGCRSFGTVMVCWLAGICHWASFQLHSNTVRGPSMRMQTACPGNVDSIWGRAIRCRLSC